MLLQIEGRYHFVLRDRGGRIKAEGSGRNLVTTLGERLAADRFSVSGTKSGSSYLTLGSGTTPPLKSNVDLQTPISATDTAGTDVVSLNQDTWSWTINGPGAGQWDVAEVGIFNEVYGHASRELVARFLTQPFTMASGDQLDMTWTLEFLGVD